MEITRHFTATTFIVHQDKVLLHLHKKLSVWLPMGGHIDRDELPHEATMREIREEAGIEVKLYNPDPAVAMGDVVQLPRPMHLLLENINPHHQHIDFIYYASCDTADLAPQSGESLTLKWFTAAEVESLQDAPGNVKALAREAIELIGSAD